MEETNSSQPVEYPTWDTAQPVREPLNALASQSYDFSRVLDNGTVAVAAFNSCI